MAAVFLEHSRSRRWVEGMVGGSLGQGPTSGMMKKRMAMKEAGQTAVTAIPARTRWPHGISKIPNTAVPGGAFRDIRLPRGRTGLTLHQNPTMAAGGGGQLITVTTCFGASGRIPLQLVAHVAPAGDEARGRARVRSMSSAENLNTVPAWRHTFSSIMAEPKSLPPKRKATCPTAGPMVDPGHLHVGKVVEVQARQGQDPQVAVAVVSSRRGKRGALGLEAPADEGGEARGFVLQARADLSRCPTHVAGRFAEAEDHGRGGAQAQAMRLAHDLQPGRDGAFIRRDALADLVVEDLGASARHRVESGGDQAFEHARDGQALPLGQMANLLGRKPVDGDGKIRLHPAKQILEVGEVKLRIHATLEQNLDATQLDGLPQFVAPARRG